jgi:hypothetical protein
VDSVLVHEQCLALTFDPPVDYSYPCSGGGRIVTRQVKTVSIYLSPTWRCCLAPQRREKRGRERRENLEWNCAGDEKKIARAGEKRCKSLGSWGNRTIFFTGAHGHPGPWGSVPACPKRQAELRAVAWRRRTALVRRIQRARPHAGGRGQPCAGNRLNNSRRRDRRQPPPHDTEPLSRRLTSHEQRSCLPLALCTHTHACPGHNHG